jgi:hypothetical protein
VRWPSSRVIVFWEKTVATITLKNSQWNNGVNVLVHVGNNSNYDLNPSRGQQRVAFNGSWPMDCGEANLQYKRDLDPDHPNGQMTGWTDVPNFGDQTTDIT